MEEEDKLCLKIHGYVSLSEDDSDFEQANVKLDNRHQLFKPPPIPINPIDHRIIEITDPIHPNMDQHKKKNVSSDGENLVQSTSPAECKTLSKSQRRNFRRRLRKKNAGSGSGGIINEDQPNDSLGQVDNSFIWRYPIDCDNKFSWLDHITTDEENRPENERSNLYYPKDNNNNTEMKTNAKTVKESKFTSYLDAETHMPSSLQCFLVNTNQLENSEENKPVKKRKGGSKKRILKYALRSECETNYLYYPYDIPDVDNFMSFKNMYLNGKLMDHHNTEVTIAKKSESTSYPYSEIQISGTLQSFLKSQTQFEKVELSNESRSDQGTGFYEVFIFTQSFLTNLVKLALQQNYTFTKEQLIHLDYVYKTLMRIHALYETFSRTSTYLLFSKVSQKESTIIRMKQNDLVHLGQAVCKSVGITFSVEDAYMIVGKFYCSMNLTTQYDLPNLEVKENLESEDFLIIYKNLNFIFDSFIGAVLLNVVWVVKQKLHEYQIRQRTLVSISDEHLINHFLKPEHFDIYSRAYSHLSIKNLEIDNFIINCLFLNQNKSSLMRTYQSFKQKTLMYDCTKVNETNLFQLILEDLTENRHYHYTTYNQRDLESWKNSQESNQNENENLTSEYKSLTPVFVGSDNGTSNITFHQSLKNTFTNLLTRIRDECFSDPKSTIKTLLFYMCLKYYRVINDSYIVVCCENMPRFTDK